MDNVNLRLLNYLHYVPAILSREDLGDLDEFSGYNLGNNFYSQLFLDQGVLVKKSLCAWNKAKKMFGVSATFFSPILR